MERQGPPRNGGQHRFWDGGLVGECQSAGELRVDLADVDIKAEAFGREFGVNGSLVGLIPAHVERAARQPRHRRQGAYHPLRSDRQSTDIASDVALGNLAGHRAGESEGHGNELGQVNDVLSLNLGPQVGGQLADPEHLA